MCVVDHDLIWRGACHQSETLVGEELKVGLFDHVQLPIFAALDLLKIDLKFGACWVGEDVGADREKNLIFFIVGFRIYGHIKRIHTGRLGQEALDHIDLKNHRVGYLFEYKGDLLAEGGDPAQPGTDANGVNGFYAA